jgi:hypothetical protein
MNVKVGLTNENKEQCQQNNIDYVNNNVDKNVLKHANVVFTDDVAK